MRRLCIGTLALASACQWVAGTEDALPRGDARADAGRDAGVTDAPLARESGIPIIDAILSDRPAALYRFAGVVDGQVLDSSGNDRHVRLDCKYEYPRPAVVVKSTDPTVGLSATAPVECTFPLPPTLDFTSGDFTYELWGRMDSLGVVLSSLSAGAVTGVELSIAGPDLDFNVTFSRRGANPQAQAFAGVRVVAPPRHIVVTMLAGTPQIWVNGAKGSGSATGRDTLPQATVRVGDAEGDYGPVGVYDYALPEDRILTHWRAGSGN